MTPYEELMGQLGKQRQEHHLAVCEYYKIDPKKYITFMCLSDKDIEDRKNITVQFITQWDFYPDSPK